MDLITKFVGDEEELSKLIAEETYLTAEECLVFGLCSEIIEDEPEVEQGDEPGEPENNVKQNLLNKYKKKTQGNQVANKATLFNAFFKKGSDQ